MAADGDFNLGLFLTFAPAGFWGGGLAGLRELGAEG